jgi:hypothetical protein
MANMTDQGRTNVWLGNILNFNNTAIVWPTALRLRLMTTMGTAPGNTSGANGTENVAATSPGYTAPSTVAITFAAVSVVAAASSNAPQWTATGTWTLGVLGVEIWDTAGTPLRWLQGTLTSAIAANAITNADTLTFAIGAVTASGAAW